MFNSHAAMLSAVERGGDVSRTDCGPYHVADDGKWEAVDRAEPQGLN